MSAKHRSRTLCSWALLAALVIVCTARPAAAWPWEQREQPKVDLRHVQEAPHTYRGRTIRFDCRFINRGQLYKRLNTRFNERQFDNFAVWPAKASLWQTAERRAVVPTLYIPVGNRKLIEFMQDLKRYDLLTVVAVVRNDYAGLPWLEVLTMEQNTDPAERLAERTLTHIRHGVTLQDGGKDLLAVEQFDLAIDGGLPSVYRPTVHQHLGECYLALDRIDEAADAYATAIAADPEDAALYIGRARVNLRRGQPDAVVADCEAALALTAEYPIVHAILGEAKAMQGQIAEGLRLCELTAFAPDASPEVKARAEVHKARIYADGQRYTEAVGAYARAIGENTPLAAVAWLRKEIGEFYEARFDETGNVEYLEEAIREYTNARVISRRQDAAGLTMLAEAFFKHAQATSGGYEEALEALQQAETASPGYVPARLLAGRIALLQGDLAEAERIFSAVSREHPNDPEAQLLMARAYEKSGEADKALLTYQRVTEAAPANVDAWVRIADLAETLGQTGLARDAYARLVDLVPDEPLYAFQLGRLSLAVDDYRTAASASRKAVADGPRGERARMNLATALHALGDIRGAEIALRELLAQNPDHTEAKAYRARLLADLGVRLSEALELAQAARDAEPGVPAVRDALGWVRYRLGDTEEALAILEPVPPADRSRAAWLHLGIVYRSLGRYDEAEAALNQAAAPLQEGEVAGIAEALRRQAEALLEETARDRREAMRLERVKRMEALRRQEAEERRAAREAEPERNTAAPVADTDADAASDNAAPAVLLDEQNDEAEVPVVEGIGMTVPLDEGAAGAPDDLSVPASARAVAPGETTGDDAPLPALPGPEVPTEEISVEDLEAIEEVGAAPAEVAPAASLPRNTVDLSAAEAAPWIDWDGESVACRPAEMPAAPQPVDLDAMDREKEEVLLIVQAWRKEAPARIAYPSAEDSAPADEAQPVVAASAPVASAQPTLAVAPAVSTPPMTAGPDLAVAAPAEDRMPLDGPDLPLAGHIEPIAPARETAAAPTLQHGPDLDAMAALPEWAF